MEVCSWTNKDGQNAHPGFELIMAATRLSRSSVHRALESLVSDGYLIRTHTSRGRGDAHVFSLGNPATAKGAHGTDSRFEVSGNVRRTEKVSDRTPIPDERVSGGTVKGVSTDTPSGSTYQAPISKSWHHSDTEASASSSDDDPRNWDDLREDYDACEEWLEGQVDGPDGVLTAQEYSTALEMFERDMHPKAIANTLSAARRHNGPIVIDDPDRNLGVEALKSTLDRLVKP